MAQLPTIYTIQASDAPQHTGRLQEILQNLKTENRIDRFNRLGAEDDLSSLTETIRDDDLILIVLTLGLESQKERIESRLKTLKTRIAEIIVDNVAYDNAFITYPADLVPVRNREDMDATWRSIEQGLKEMLPVQEDEERVHPIAWPKYLKIAGIILLVITLAWTIPNIITGSGPEARFTYYIGEHDQDTITECYPPCNVQFINESQNFESSQWEIGDTVFTDRHLRLQDVPGERLGDVERFQVGSAESAIVQVMMVGSGCVDEVGRQHVGVEAPDADAQVAHEQPVLRVHLDPVRARRAARELHRDTGLRHVAIHHDRQPPDLLRARDADVAVLLGGGERDAVRARHVVGEPVERAVRPQPVDAPGGIGDPGLPLVGEVEVAVGGEMEIVQPLEPLAERGLEHGFEPARLRVERE